MLRKHATWVGAALALGALLFGCGSRDLDRDSGLQTLHASTLSHTVSDGPQIAALFADGRRAVVVDSILGKVNTIYFADLQAGTVKPIKTGGIEMHTFVPAGDRVFAAGVGPDQQVWEIDDAGTMRSMQTLSLVLYTIGDYDRIAAQHAQMLALIEQGALDDLVEVQFLKFDARGNVGTYIDGFFNDTYFISINAANERDLATLRARTNRTIVNDYTSFAAPQAPDLQIEVERQPYVDFAGATNTQNITRIVVRRDAEAVASFELKGMYHDAVVVNDRLYVIGESIKYLDLKTLP